VAPASRRRFCDEFSRYVDAMRSLNEKIAGEAPAPPEAGSTSQMQRMGISCEQ
jgi:hypothetical protein